MATKDDIADLAGQLTSIERELKTIRRDLDDLCEKVKNVSGFRKKIDHALERIGAIERHLGIAKNNRCLMDAIDHDSMTDEPNGVTSDYIVRLAKADRTPPVASAAGSRSGPHSRQSRFSLRRCDNQRQFHYTIKPRTMREPPKATVQQALEE